jgi:hypothetical protein
MTSAFISYSSNDRSTALLSLDLCPLDYANVPWNPF